MTDQPQEPELIEFTLAPEILVDGYASTIITAGVAKFAFFTLAQAPNGQMQRRIVLRLAASLPILKGIHTAMGQLLEQVAAMGAQEPKQ